MSTINQSQENISNNETQQNDLEEIEQIDSIEFFISTLSPEEIQAKIESYKEITQNQLHQMSNLLNHCNNKVSKLTKAQHKPPYIKGNASNTTGSFNHKADEVNQLHKEHQKKIKALERDTEVKLIESLRGLEEMHNNEMRRISEEHESKVNDYYSKMENAQKTLNDLNDKRKYVSKKEHENIINQIQLKYVKEIEAYDEEIAKLESVIKETYSQWINKANHSITQPNISVTSKSNMNQIKEFVTKLKYENGNDNFIYIVSQMSRPSHDAIDHSDSNEERKSIFDENYYRIDDKDILEFEKEEKKPIRQIIVNNFTMKKFKGKINI